MYEQLWKIGSKNKIVWTLPDEVALYVKGEDGADDPLRPKLSQTWLQKDTGLWRITTLLQQEKKYLMKVLEFSKEGKWVQIAEGITENCYSDIGGCGDELQKYISPRTWDHQLGYRYSLGCGQPTADIEKLYLKSCSKDKIDEKILLSASEKSGLVEVNIACSPGEDDYSVDFAPPVTWIGKNKMKRELEPRRNPELPPSQISICQHGEKVLVQNYGYHVAKIYDLKTGELVLDLSKYRSAYWVMDFQK